MSAAEPDYLPFGRQGRTWRAEPPEVPRLPSRQPGMLVVDDEEGVRGVLDAGLRHQGFVVWLAASGREALDLYQRHRAAIDLVLLDVRMPGLDGPQTLAALRELNPRVRCCFMSGDTGRYSEEGLRGLGAVTTLAKPFRLAEVARQLWELAGAAAGSPSPGERRQRAGG